MSNVLKMLSRGGAVSAPSDADFENVTLLLHGDGTNGAQNNTFLDSSTNNFTITRNGNTTQGTFTPFSKPDGRWGNYFDGTSAGLENRISGTVTAIGTGNFTIAFWVYVTGSTTKAQIFTDSENGVLIQINSSNQLAFFNRVTSSFVISASASTELPINQWAHVSLIRSGTGSNQTKLYINGTEVGQATESTNFTGTVMSIGSRFNTTGTEWFPTLGYISNFIYTDSALSSAVPTGPYTNVSGTRLLTCQSNRFKDNSSNNIALTVTSNVKVTPFSPFPTLTAYDAATNGGSGYFDGSGDYIQLADNAALELASESSWTVEFWGYFVSTPSDFDVILGKGTASGSYEYFFEAFSDNTIDILYSADGTTTWTGQHQITPAIPNGQWFHLAAVRNGATFKSYVNGVEYFSGSSFNIYAGSGVLNIGGFSGSATQDPNMYISGLRVVKGTAVYTSNFTIPSAPPTAITNTSLLCNFTNAGILDNSMSNNLETVGNAQIDTTTKKYGTGSMEFDGTGDWLVAPYDPNYAFGTGAFTIEFWIYANNISGIKGVWAYSAGGGAVQKFVLHLDAGVPKIHINGIDGISGAGIYLDGVSSISATTWTHIAFTRSGSTYYCFINGTQTNSGSNSTNLAFTTPLQYVGYGGEVYFADFNGFIDDLRITKGIARYTSNFTPPTAAFEDIGE